MKLNKLIFTVLSILAITSSLLSVNAAEIPVESSSDQTIGFDEDEGMYFIDFTVSPTSDDMQTVYSSITALPGGFYTSTSDIVAEHSIFSASILGDTSNVDVAVQLKVKSGQSFYNVSGGYTTFKCDGNIYEIFQEKAVTVGKTYRFYFKALGSDTECPNLYIAATFWD